MAVAIQGKCCGIMPHVFLNRLDVVPCADGINRESVATIMQTMMIKPSILQCLLECLPDSRLREMTSICMRKDEVRELSLVPQVSGYTLLLFLIFLMMEWRDATSSPMVTVLWTRNRLERMCI